MLIILLSGCTIVEITPGQTAPVEEQTESGEPDDAFADYSITEYELKENAIEVTGELKKYAYADLDGADRFIDVLNEYFDVELKADEDLSYDNGYANWSWSEGEFPDVKDVSVSACSKTGKFSLYLTPHNKDLVAVSQAGDATEEKLIDKATDFVNKFSFITGDLTFEYSIPDNDLYYPFISEDGGDTEEMHVAGRRFLFSSEQYSKQTVSANDSLICPVECGNEDQTLRNVQYFSVTLLADGTIVSAVNCITKAQITDNGDWKMITSDDIDKLVGYFYSTVKDDKLIITRIYVESYNNYFGNPDINPVLNIEYYLESAPENVRTSQMSIEGFYN